MSPIAAFALGLLSGGVNSWLLARILARSTRVAREGPPSPTQGVLSGFLLRFLIDAGTLFLVYLAGGSSWSLIAAAGGILLVTGAVTATLYRLSRGGGRK